jgi:hypothetical protein
MESNREISCDSLVKIFSGWPKQGRVAESVSYIFVFCKWFELKKFGFVFVTGTEKLSRYNCWLRAGRQESHFRHGKQFYFLHSFKPISRPTQSLIQLVPGAFSTSPRDWNGRRVNLTTQLHLVQRPITMELYPPLVHISSWSSAHFISTVTILLLPIFVTTIYV